MPEYPMRPFGAGIERNARADSAVPLRRRRCVVNDEPAAIITHTCVINVRINCVFLFVAGVILANNE